MEYRHLPRDVRPVARAYEVFRETAFLSIFAVPIVLAISTIVVSLAG